MTPSHLSTSTIPISSIDVQFADGPGKIHAISTGQVQVKKGFRDAKGGPLTSKIRFLMEKAFTEWMPIWVWVIEHPEGVFVVDTGENAEVTEVGYFANEPAFLRWVNKTQFRFQVQAEEEIGPQLQQLGIDNSQLNSVILTHLHLDHFDGLRHFEGVPVLVNRLEWDKPSSALPSLYPEWFSPTLLDLEPTEMAGFAGKALTQSGELMMIATPGHTHGHISVLLQTQALHYLFAGDVTYNQPQLIHNQMSAASTSFKQARFSIIHIQAYSRSHPLIYLPSHDQEAADRLMQGRILEVR